MCFAYGLRALSLIALLLISQQGIADELGDNLEVCQSCHGAEMIDEDALVPIISGQHFFSIYTQLKDYKAERRSHDIMTSMTADLDKKMMKALAAHYSEQEWECAPAPTGEYNKQLAERTMASGQCTQCHGTNYIATSGVPRLACQKQSYLSQTMRAFRDKTRQNAAAKSSLFQGVSDEAIEAVAQYLAER
jgi:cytochrome c553